MRTAMFLTLSVALGLSSLASGQTAPARNGSTAATGRYVAIGCMTRQGTAAAPRYVVTDPRGDRPTVYRLDGDGALLARHVGHTVEVRGGLSPSGALKVDALVWIASSCKK